jgi:hypothetical protein
MNSFSHILIGKLLSEYLKTTYGVKLCKMSYLYGNILPDFIRRYKSRPHEPACWESYIKNEIGSLLEHRNIGRDTSRRLGILSHFIADFFCYPHTGAYTGTAVAHLRYEWALHSFLRKNLDDLRRTDFGNTCGDGIAGNAAARTERIYGCFEKLYKEYLDQEPSYTSDVLYTLSAGADSLAMIARSTAADRETPVAVALVAGTAEA